MKKTILLTLILALLPLCGCSTGMQAFKNRNLSVNDKISQPVFLNAKVGERIYICITNVTSHKEVSLADDLKDNLRNQGFVIVDSANEADLVISGCIGYFGPPVADPDSMIVQLQKMQEMGQSAQLTNTAITAINYSRLGIDGMNMGTIGISSMAGTATNLVSAGIGKAFKVKTYSGIMDLRIKESKTGKVHETRIVATAKQTNLNEDLACKAVVEVFVTRTSDLFLPT